MASENLSDLAIDYLISLPVETDKGKVGPRTKAQPDDDHQFVKDHVDVEAGLKLPKGAAAEQVRDILGLLKEYAADESDDKPLSIAIFGPPGSGKSTFVRNIANSIDGICHVKTANLTQVTDTEELADVFKNIAISMQCTSDIPLVFFDEFDTMRHGTPRGWLSWFLAPMEDGVVLAKGQEIAFGKAVFIFAGGTAETLDEFNARAKLDPDTYRARKVPDFVSRLRGAIDIGGVNGHGDERIVQRALALSYHLNGDKAKALGEDRLRQILQNGYFVHGARSIKTFLKAELAKVSRGDGGGDRGASGLPTVIRRQHFSRGSFDGVAVGLSAGLEKDGSQDVSSSLTDQLLRSGASLIYAGAFFEEGTLNAIRDQAASVPGDLVEETGARARVVNYLGVPATHDCQPDIENVFACEPLETISDEELLALKAPIDKMFDAIPRDGSPELPKNHLAWAISQFRLRVRVMQDVGALVALGGKDDGSSWGRMPGIAEEAMIAMALNKPVYVLGAGGGAAETVGRLLGLSDAPVSRKRCLVPSSNEDFLRLLGEHESEFDIPGVSESPKTMDEVRDFFFARGVNTSAWPGNGLTADENRELFKCDISKDADRAVQLILSGLSRLEWEFER